MTFDNPMLRWIGWALLAAFVVFYAKHELCHENAPCRRAWRSFLVARQLRRSQRTWNNIARGRPTNGGPKS